MSFLIILVLLAAIFIFAYVRGRNQNDIDMPMEVAVPDAPPQEEVPAPVVKAKKPTGSNNTKDQEEVVD